MISLDEYARHDGLGLAELVATKQVTPRELADAGFEEIRKVSKYHGTMQVLTASR